MSKCDMTSAQIYNYVTEYNDSIWNRILENKDFSDLIDDFIQTGIMQDKLGQTIVTAYQQSEPCFTSESINGDMLFHVLKNNDTILANVNIRNICRDYNTQSKLNFLCYMMTAPTTSKTFSDLYKDFNFKGKTLSLEKAEKIVTEYEPLFLTYQNAITELFELFDSHKSNNLPAYVYDYREISSFMQSLNNLIDMRENFTMLHIADLISKDVTLYNAEPEYGEKLYTSILDTSLYTELLESDISDYQQVLSDWIKKNSDKLSEYNSIPLPFRMEDALKENQKKMKNNQLASRILNLGIKHPYNIYNDSLRAGKYETKSEYLDIILLEIFLFLGLPSNTLEQFMNIFGIAFGSGYRNLCPNHPFSQHYVKYLIDNGISYHIIQFLIEEKLYPTRKSNS